MQTNEEMIAEIAACYASNSMQQTVQYRRIEVSGMSFIRFYLFHSTDTGSSWPVEMVSNAEGNEKEFGAAVVSVLSETKKPDHK